MEQNEGVDVVLLILSLGMLLLMLWGNAWLQKACPKCNHPRINHDLGMGCIDCTNEGGECSVLENDEDQMQ